MNMKQLTFDEYVLVVVFAVVSFLTVVFAGYITTAYQTEKLSQGYYGSNTVYLQVNDPENQLDYEALYRGMKDAIVFRELAGDLVRGVLLRGDVEPPPLLKGRFFEEDDFFNGKRLVVAGNAYDPAIQKRNGREYIKINEQYYEVIGRLGTEGISQLDNMLLVNLDAIDLGKNGIYAIDGKSVSRINAFSTLLKNQAVKSGANYDVIEREPSGIKRLLKYEQSSTFVYLVLLMVCLLSSTAVNLSLYEKKKIEIAVQRLLGFNSLQIIGQLMKYYAVLAHIGYIGGLLSGLFLVSLGIISISHPLPVASSYLTLMIFGLLILTVPVAQVLHSPTREIFSE